MAEEYLKLYLDLNERFISAPFGDMGTFDKIAIDHLMSVLRYEKEIYLQKITLLEEYCTTHIMTKPKEQLTFFMKYSAYITANYSAFFSENDLPHNLAGDDRIISCFYQFIGFMLASKVNAPATSTEDEIQTAAEVGSKKFIDVLRNKASTIRLIPFASMFAVANNINELIQRSEAVMFKEPLQSAIEAVNAKLATKPSSRRTTPPRNPSSPLPKKPVVDQIPVPATLPNETLEGEEPAGKMVARARKQLADEKAARQPQNVVNKEETSHPFGVPQSASSGGSKKKKSKSKTK